jgi:hypothetical protein
MIVYNRDIDCNNVFSLNIISIKMQFNEGEIPTFMVDVYIQLEVNVSTGHVLTRIRLYML